MYDLHIEMQNNINGKLFLYYMCFCINFLYISFCAYILQHSSLNLLSLHYSNKEHDCREKQPDAIFVFVYNHQLDYQRSGMYNDHNPVKFVL
jgi:hypothetical protein